MSPTPIVSSAPQSSHGAGQELETGDAVKLDIVQARGAQRTGAIWILVISLALAVAVLGVFWLSQAPRMQSVNHPSGRDLNVQDVRKFNTPPPPAPSPPATKGS